MSRSASINDLPSQSRLFCNSAPRGPEKSSILEDLALTTDVVFDRLLVLEIHR